MAKKTMAEPKLSKASVNYRPGEGKRRCANCTKFRPPHTCLHVEGIINPGDLCDRFVSAFKRSWYDRKDEANG
jgi:hypothetical protein